MRFCTASLSVCLQQARTSNRDILSCRYGDMRVMMGCEIFSMWQNLGKMMSMHTFHMDGFNPKFTPKTHDRLFKGDSY